jgi:hypothetical protein
MVVVAMVVGCADSSVPAHTVSNADTTLVMVRDTASTQKDVHVQMVDSTTKDSTPAERQAAAKQRRRDSDMKRKASYAPYPPYEPGKGDVWAIRKQDSILKAQKKPRKDSVK